MDDNSYKRKSPFGISLLVISALAILLTVLVLGQRGCIDNTPEVGAETMQVDGD